MSDASFTRKLSTIIAVDVSNYSSMVEADEELALKAVDLARQTITDIVTAYGGRIFNHAGDAVMAETPSVVEGVQSAFDIHKALADLSRHDPELPEIKVRIGVNLGDVMNKEDGDLVGHGVNIAVRLEQIAKPGETVISQAVFEQLRGTIEALFEAAGYERLKNISSPVAVYRATQFGQHSLIKRFTGRALRPARWMILAGAMLVAVLGMMAGMLLSSTPEITGRSIAVLPFTNVQGDDESAYFSDGVTEEIQTLLVRLEDIRVIARASAFQFRGEDLNPADIRRQLGVSHLLEGSVRRRGERVRVSVSLVDTRSNESVWSDSFERQLTDIFAIQRDIAENVATALQVELLGNDTPISAMPVDPEAYQLYLRGRSMLAQRGAAIPQAIAAFQQVTARAPDYADGWASLAMALQVLPGHSDVPYGEVAAPAGEAAERALALEADHAEALAVRGVQARRRGEWRAAEAAFEAALESDPSNVTAWFWYGEFYLSVGRVEAAYAALAEAADLDPLSPIMIAGRGWAHYFRDDLAAAEQDFMTAWDDYGLKARNVWEGLYSVALERQAYEEARSLLDVIPGSDGLRTLHTPFLNALEDPEGGAATLLVEAFDRMGPDQLPYYYPLEAYARLGRHEQAITTVLDAAHAGKVDETQILFAPGTVGVRRHPDFLNAAQQLGLVEYWQAAAAPDFCQHGAELSTCRAIRRNGS